MTKQKHIFLSVVTILALVSCATTSPKTINSQQEQTYIDQAKLALDNESSDQALEALNQAIQINKKNPQSYLLQAQAFEQQNDLSNATKSYDKVFDLDPKNGVAFSAYATTLCHLDTNSSLDSLNKMYDKAADLELKNNTNSQTAINQINANKANCLLYKHKTEEATTLFETVISNGNPPVNAYTGLTQAYLDEGNYPKAALIISSVPNTNQNRQVLSLKIDALSGLLDKKYHIKDENRKLLLAKIKQLNEQLQQPSSIKKSSNLAVVEKPAPVKVIKPIMPAQSANTDATPIKASTPTSTTAIPQSLPPIATTSTATKKAQPVEKANPTAVKPTNSTFAKRIHKAPNGKRYVVVKNGDTLFSISKASGLTQQQLIKINHLKNEYVPLDYRVYLD